MIFSGFLGYPDQEMGDGSGAGRKTGSETRLLPLNLWAVAEV